MTNTENKEQTNNNKRIIAVLGVIVVVLLMIIAYLLGSQTKESSTMQQALSQNDGTKNVQENTGEDLDSNPVAINLNNKDRENNVGMEKDIDPTTLGLKQYVGVAEDGTELFSFYYDEDLDIQEFINTWKDGQRVLPSIDSYSNNSKYSLTVSIEKISNLPEMGFGYTKQQALDDIEALKDGEQPKKTEQMAGYDFQEVINLPNNKKGIKKYGLGGNQNIPDLFSLGQKVIFYVDNYYQVEISLVGNTEEVALLLPQYIHQEPKYANDGDVNSKYYAWRDTAKQEDLYLEIINGTAPEYIMSWDKKFNEIIETVEITEK